MPTGPLSGPGVGLQLPQYLYPSELFQAPPDASTNRVCLGPGQEIPVQRGDWLISLGKYLILEFKDPVTGQWFPAPGAGWNHGHNLVSSDGFSVRIANRLGCPVTATVQAFGSGYVQATTFVTQTPGNGTWVPIVGGQLTLVGGTVTAPGAGYGVAPIVLIPAPPGPSNNPNGIGGVQASGFASITNGTISSFSFTNPGAGYPVAPIATVLPNPTDPNILVGITNGTITFSLTGSGSITGAFNTNPGAPLANPNQCSLVITGAGSGGSLLANVLQTVTSASVSGAGVGSAAGATALLTTVGGVPPAGSIANGPDSLGLSWLPRPAQIGLTTTAGTITTQLGTIYDGGLFLTNSAPATVIVENATGSITSNPTLVMTMGSRPDIATLQPLNT
jgi:hypothetical protein